MRSVVGTLIATLAIAAPAAAQPSAPFVVPDGCSDVSTAIVKVAGEQVNFDAGRAAWHDIDNATLTARDGGGIDIALQLCADVPAPQLFSNGWYVTANVSGGCYIQIGVVDDAPGNPTRSGKMFKDCPGQDVLGRPGITQVYSGDLPATAWSVAGKTISFHLTKTQLAPLQATSLKDPGAYTGDGARITEASQGDVFSVNGPGTKDSAASQGIVELD